MRPSLAAIALCALTASAAFAGDSDLKAAIDAQNTKFEQAYNTGDMDAVAALYSEDGAVLPPGAARQDGRDAIRAFWSGAMEGGLKDVDLTAVEVYPQGDVATEVGGFTASAPAAEGGGHVRDGGYGTQAGSQGRLGGRPRDAGPGLRRRILGGRLERGRARSGEFLALCSFGASLGPGSRPRFGARRRTMPILN